MSTKMIGFTSVLGKANPTETPIITDVSPRKVDSDEEISSTEPDPQLGSISMVLDFNMDNTLNSIKLSGGGIRLCRQKEVSPDTDIDVNNVEVKNHKNNNNNNNNNINCDNCISSNSTNTKNNNSNPIPLNADESKEILPPTPPATPSLQNVARKRWRILAKVLRKDSSEETVSSSSEECNEEQTASVRRFKSFDLLRQDSFEDHVTLNCLGKPENWYKYSVQLDGPNEQEYFVNIHHVERHLTANDLMGFNNTGNICVWPSEEALTAFVLSDLEAYRGKWILELGGGFTCLSGLMLSKYAKPYAVHLTDGNEVSVENVKKTVCLNELSCYTKCSVLKWEESHRRSLSEAGKFDIILSADCLFFDEARSALVDTIWFYLSLKGEALIMAPRRGKTMTFFIRDCVQRGFSVQMMHRYNDTIWRRHLELQHSALYDEDLHYPVLIHLSKLSPI